MSSFGSRLVLVHSVETPAAVGYWKVKVSYPNFLLPTRARNDVCDVSFPHGFINFEERYNMGQKIMINAIFV